MLQGLKHRLEGLESPGSLAGAADSFQQLLEVSMEQSQEQARAMLVSQILAGTTADEARLLAALSDGSGFPMLTLYTGGRFSPGVVHYRHSNIGRAAGIQCTDFIAFYLSRLFARGLVVAAGFSEARRTDYELLEGDSDYRKAEEALKAHSPKLKVRRETLHMSPLGSKVWALLGEDAASEE
ncbi:MAG: hypothetical protein CL550_02100 [Alcanivorax sp.]|nr:hypothetical protein [Alcanivorax sp.]